MTDQTAIVTVRNEDGLMPALTIQDAISRYNTVIEFTKAVMKPGKDYGVIPGTGDKPTLLKPGAEKLCSLFGLFPDFEPMDHVIDFETGLFYLQYKCTLSRNGRNIASGLGSANSREKKYRYRNSSRKCPVCGKETIIKGKAEYGGGWLCYEKKGGCKAKFQNGDPAIEAQQVGQIENPDTADILNTLDKMAQKRALVAAALIATNASEFFTQDIEDMEIIEGSWSKSEDREKSPLEVAADFVTNTGTRFGDLTKEQLETIRTESRRQDWRDAASIILASMEAE